MTLGPASIPIGSGSCPPYPVLSHSWLDETGAPIKMQWEPLRHASIKITMNVYD